MKKTLLLLSLFALLLASCEKADDWISRRYPGRRFFFFHQEHPTSLLFAAYQNPGMWVYVYCRGDGVKDYRHVYVQSNDEQMGVEDNVVSTERERRAAYILGASNEIGLIVGCTFFNGPKAYDRICPNCTTLQALRWTQHTQHVACQKCKREYDLETGAIVAGDGGEALLRYGCSYDGNCLYVGN